MFKPDLKKDILAMIEKSQEKKIEKLYQNYGSVFVFPNEKLSQLFLKEESFVGKKVLSILSGGGFPLECILKGSREIDCFDLNRLTFYFFELMLASIKGLSYQEYLEFWHLKSTTTPMSELMKEEIYHQFSKYLKEEYKVAWDSFYDVSFGLGKKQNLIVPTNSLYLENPQTLSYQNEKVFYQLKKILLEEEIKFRYFHLNLENILEEKELDQYHVIYFSNVMENYSMGNLSKNTGRELIICKTYENLLKKDGIFYAYYSAEKVSQEYIMMILDFLKNQNVPSLDAGISQEEEEELLNDILQKNPDNFRLEKVLGTSHNVLVARKN